MKPLHLALGIGTLGGLLLFAFVPVSTLSPQSASTAYAQSTPSVSFTQEEVQGKEGSTIYLRVKLNTPVTKTTRVTIKLTPDQGTTSRDIPGLTGTKTVTFYKNGTQTKTVAIRTSRTTAEADKAVTASITKVGNTTVKGDTARIVVKDQKSSTSLANNQNTNTQTQNTTTPPTDCKQYEGVIPGETRKLSVEYRGWALQKYNYPISAEAQAQLNTMRGDLGNVQSFARGRQGGGFGRWTREFFPSGTVYVWPIKTTEYNDKVVLYISGVENPLTVDGSAIMSVSKCPGDFTSPQLLSQRMASGERLPACVGANPVFGGISLIVTSGNPNGYTCDLEPNSQYYLNISAGFSKTSPLDQNGMPTQSPGLGIGGRSNGTTWIFPGVQSADMNIYAQDYRGQGYNARPANGAPGLIKGKDEYYRENDRVAGIVAAAMQQRVMACRAAIGTGTGDRGVLGGGGECNGLPTPLPAYEWE
jgi:hypothetical protein